MYSDPNCNLPRMDSSLKNMCNSKSEIELGNKERRHSSPRTSVMWFSLCAASIGVGLSFMSLELCKAQYFHMVVLLVQNYSNLGILDLFLGKWNIEGQHTYTYY
jgi:hypothetical protein